MALFPISSEGGRWGAGKGRGASGREEGNKGRGGGQRKGAAGWGASPSKTVAGLVVPWIGDF